MSELNKNRKPIKKIKRVQSLNISPEMEEKAISIISEHIPGLSRNENEMLLSLLKEYFQKEIKNKGDFTSWLESENGLKFFKFIERTAIDSRKIIDFALHPKFVNELELLLGTDGKFTNDEKLDIVKRLIEITKLTLSNASNDSIYNKFLELGEKYRDKYTPNLSGYFYDQILFDKSVGDGKYDFYTFEEYDALLPGLNQITGDEHKFFLKERVQRHLNVELWRIFSQPKELQSPIKKISANQQGKKNRKVLSSPDAQLKNTEKQNLPKKDEAGNKDTSKKITEILTPSKFEFDKIPIARIFKEKIMSKGTFYREIKKKKIKLHKVNTLSFISQSDFNRLFEEAFPTVIDRLKKEGSK